MNILSITPALSRANHLNSINSPVQNKNVTVPKLNNLSKDTVSFSGIGGASSKVSDFLEAQVAADTPRLRRLAITYLDILESVAFRLKDKGFSFDRAYCELNPVKSPKSYSSKIVRSGKFKVPDTIRATLYCNNPYDLDSLNSLLTEMKKRGYVLGTEKMTIKDLMKRGYIPTEEEAKKLDLEKTVPDLDIRLDDVADQVTKLPEELKYSIGKPQKSGYEDIQMRFVRDFDSRKNPVSHELLIVFGPNYSKAKHAESSFIYTPLRELDELHVDLSNKTIGSHSQKASRYIDLIKQMFRGKVSEKLFLNAKNKDLYDLSDSIPISFSETDVNMFENYFSGLNDRVSSVYKEARKAPKITDSEKKQLAKDLRSDKTLLNKVHDNLKKAISHNFNAD
jgi:hypothetical protein